MTHYKTAIFGCGYHGRAAYRKCKVKGIKVVNWIDNNTNIIGKKYFNLPIKGVKDLKELNIDQIILCGRNINDQIKQLKKTKFNKKIKVWNFFDIKPSKKNIIKRDKKLYDLLKFTLFELNKYKIHYWADTSGLLTIVRKDNISLLSDFDIAIDYENMHKVFKIFKNNKKTNVIKITNRIKNKDYPQIYLKSINNIKNFEPAVIDFSFYKKIKKTYYKFDNYRKKIPEKFLVNYEFAKYKDLKIRIPKKKNEYLENIYGKTFKKKVKFYSNPLKYKSMKSNLILNQK